ncbi:hypothetical protein [Leptonema illini]|uniref:Lipoprotein n=1 Tax=Leptonema illini DSM 21528 TaxID=929563 RepID=H2CHE9_9LEPT|nr:hypothetical protein [Leptonema illini]EHQ08022.1 hypothetical protein Lepil_3363 [Leptonema illini DSM 21528]
MKTLKAWLLLLLIVSCASPQRKDEIDSGKDSRSKPEAERKTDESTALTAEESRRRAEKAYEEMLRREREQKNSDISIEQDQTGKEEAKKETVSDVAQKDEGRDSHEDSDRQNRLEEQMLADEAKKERERTEAVALLSKDREEEQQARKAQDVYSKNRPLMQEEARRLSVADASEQKLFDQDYEHFLAAKKRDEEYRSSRIAKVDTGRDLFYRLDALKMFPSRLEIGDVRSRSIQLMRNRNRQQFMGFVKDMKYVPLVQAVPLPGGPPSRLRLYEFFKGRPGNYVLLEDGQPVTIRVKNQNYRIINIRSDGDVLIILDLERDDFKEYYRLSVDDIVLVLE